MKLSELKNHLSNITTLNVIQPNGKQVPSHFHITEVGLTTKHFIDCGGDIHTDKYANIQIWVADDIDHRLKPSKFIHIIDLSEKVLSGEDLEIEVEYQNETIGIYGLDVDGENFKLTTKHTDCLAKAKCNLPQPKQKLQLVNLAANDESCCTPGGACC
ncbi:MAG: DUF6428 family protein [Bacteroidota bacterium]|nr:DUF6428 family protein [Bacteroidota bacterium]